MTIEDFLTFLKSFAAAAVAVGAAIGLTAPAIRVIRFNRKRRLRRVAVVNRAGLTGVVFQVVGAAYVRPAERGASGQ